MKWFRQPWRNYYFQPALLNIEPSPKTLLLCRENQPLT
jgi:hypothetical protein